MTEWNPQNLCDCLGSESLGRVTALLCLGVCFWYAAITRRWLDAAKHASNDGCKVWSALAIVFIICAVAGYGTMALALFYPRLAVSLRVGFLILQNIACPIFLRYASTLVFTTISHNERLGQSLREALGGDKNIEQMDQKQVQAMVKAHETLAEVRMLVGVQAKELVLRSAEIERLLDEIATKERAADV